MAVEFQMTFMHVEHCPACGSVSKEIMGRLPGKSYRVGDIVIPYEKNIGSINIIKCNKCGLFYKDWLPAKKELLELFRSVYNEVWGSSYSYIDELKLIEQLFPADRPDILDIGASAGGFLSNSADIAGRLSALDVMENAECRKIVTGEYILAFLDQDRLDWSRESYDLVTLFDVVEHLYDAKKGFQNLQSLVKIGGFCIIETGNSDHFIPTYYGIHNWWYFSLAPHHLAFNFNCLVRLGTLFGFRLVSHKFRRHKNMRMLSLKEFVKLSIKSGVYLIYPHMYRWLGKKMNKEVNQPIFPFTPDHLLMVFQRIR